MKFSKIIKIVCLCNWVGVSVEGGKEFNKKVGRVPRSRPGKWEDRLSVSLTFRGNNPDGALEGTK